jgi:hypothetical protein
VRTEFTAALLPTGILGRIGHLRFSEMPLLNCSRAISAAISEEALAFFPTALRALGFLAVPTLCGARRPPHSTRNGAKV